VLPWAATGAQVLTTTAQATALWITLAGHWLTPYTIEPVQWLVLVWLLVRWIRVRDDRLLLALGAAAGVAAETKFQVLLLCAVLAGAALLLGPRELLTRPSLWAGRSYGYFAPPPESADAVLYIGSGPNEVAPYFTGVREVADGGPDASVWLCTGRRAVGVVLATAAAHLTVE
jgi:hypothetical protein